MTKHERFPEFNEYINALALCCRSETYHGEYAIRCQFCDEPKGKDEDGLDTLADINVDHVYLTMTLRVYPPLFDIWLDADFKSVGRAILHELCHGYLAPVESLFMWDACESQRWYYRQTIERQVQRIAYSLYDLLPKEWYLPENLKSKGGQHDSQ